MKKLLSILAAAALALGLARACAESASIGISEYFTSRLGLRWLPRKSIPSLLLLT